MRQVINLSCMRLKLICKLFYVHNANFFCFFICNSK